MLHLQENKIKTSDINTAIHHLHQNHVIAYPTEGVYGFGCNPFDEKAVERLLTLKKREMSKGLILIAHSFAAISPYVILPGPKETQEILRSWPGPVNWVLEATEKVPEWIKGEHETVAVRVTHHPLAKQLCEAWGKPLVSTSANRAAEQPAKTAEEVDAIFQKDIDCILMGAVGDRQGPCEIRHAVTGEILRP